MTRETQYVQTRPLGDFTVTAINDGTIKFKPQLTVPEEIWRQAIAVDASGRVAFDVNVLLVRTGNATILIDAGLDDPESSWDQEFLQLWPGSVRTPGVAAGLASVGVTPDDLTHILLTHAHFDHVMGLAFERDGRLTPRYPRARVLIGRSDWVDVPGEHLTSSPRVRIGAVQQAGLLELVDAEREVVPGVRMIPAPGESPGHSIVRMASQGETLFAVGDLFHHAAEVEHLDWMVPWAAASEMAMSRERLVDEAANTDAIVVFTHETFPPWGRIVGDARGGYRWRRISGP